MRSKPDQHLFGECVTCKKWGFQYKLYDFLSFSIKQALLYEPLVASETADSPFATDVQSIILP